MRILMIEDDRNLSDATSLQLMQAGYEVDAAYDGEEGLFYLEQGVYDLVLLDRLLPYMDGISVLRAARAKGITTPVLLLTALGQINDKVAGLDSGADDYMVKPFHIQELLARIRALIRRPGAITACEEIYYGDLMLDLSALFLQGSTGRCTLSKKEGALLEVLMKSEGQTLTRQSLFARVWGADSDVEEASLDSYTHFVRRRLAAVSHSVKLVTVRGVGYRLEDTSHD